MCVLLFIQISIYIYFFVFTNCSMCGCFWYVTCYIRSKNFCIKMHLIPFTTGTKLIFDSRTHKQILLSILNYLNRFGFHHHSFNNGNYLYLHYLTLPYVSMRVRTSIFLKIFFVKTILISKNIKKDGKQWNIHPWHHKVDLLNPRRYWKIWSHISKCIATYKLFYMSIGLSFH